MTLINRLLRTFRLYHRDDEECPNCYTEAEHTLPADRYECPNPACPVNEWYGYLNYGAYDNWNSEDS